MEINIIKKEHLENYRVFLHYTDYEALSYILLDKTLKFNNLKNVNDKFEKKREGLEEFAGTRYIFCLCHQDYEIVPFWYVYGKANKKEKVMLRFSNFSNKLKEVIESDYVFDNQNNIIKCEDNIQNSQERLRLVKLIMFDIEYDEKNNINSKQNITSESYIPNPEQIMQGKAFPYAKYRVDATTLGRVKTINWKYEEETRLMCTANLMDSKKEVECLFVRVKDEIFRNLEIVVNPWADDILVGKIEKLIQKTRFSDEIKKSIKVVRSELDGLLIE